MITFRDIHAGFEGRPVLRGVDLDVPRGASMVLIGGSGTGKSVLLRSVLGLVAPARGEIRVDGEIVAGAGITPRPERFLPRFGMLFQGAALFDSLPVWQNVAFRLLHGTPKRPREAARALAIEKLRRVGLEDAVADRYPSELSGGMRKRVGLARAIATDPEILFCDEPTTGLDPILSGVINGLIRDIVTETGATAITITHDMTSLRRIADSVALLHEGVIRWTGPLAEMDDAPDPALQQFIHGSADGPFDTLR